MHARALRRRAGCSPEALRPYWLGRLRDLPRAEIRLFQRPPGSDPVFGRSLAESTQPHGSACASASGSDPRGIVRARGSPRSCIAGPLDARRSRVSLRTPPPRQARPRAPLLRFRSLQHSLATCCAVRGRQLTGRSRFGVGVIQPFRGHMGPVPAIHPSPLRFSAKRSRRDRHRPRFRPRTPSAAWVMHRRFSVCSFRRCSATHACRGQHALAGAARLVCHTCAAPTALLGFSALRSLAPARGWREVIPLRNEPTCR